MLDMKARFQNEIKQREGHVNEAISDFVGNRKKKWWPLNCVWSKRLSRGGNEWSQRWMSCTRHLHRPHIRKHRPKITYRTNANSRAAQPDQWGGKKNLPKGYQQKLELYQGAETSPWRNSSRKTTTYSPWLTANALYLDDQRWKSGLRSDSFSDNEPNAICDDTFFVATTSTENTLYTSISSTLLKSRLIRKKTRKINGKRPKKKARRS